MAETLPAGSIDKEAYLAAIIESSEDAIISKNLNSIVTSWNPAAERVFGFTAEEMVGQSIVRLIPLERHSEEDEIISQLRRGERIEHFETIRQRKDGERIEVSVTISPIRNSAGVIIGASKIARDITAQKREEREREELLARERHLREEAERANQIKNEFLATLSHELRTPLMSILGWAQILRAGPATPDVIERASEVIYRNTRMQAQLVDDLLDMNRILVGKVRLEIQPIEISQLIETAVESARPSAEAKNIALTVVLDPQAGVIRGDPARLQQIVWNLLTNAIKFTPKGGRVEIGLHRIESNIEISVRDNGIGIKPEFLAHVFDRFTQEDSSTTRRHGGLGIGLAIVRHLVELHGGMVSAASEGEKQGATFRVVLPIPPVMHRANFEVSSDRHLAIEPAPTWSFVNLVGKRILVVDDSPDNCEIIEQIISPCGAEIISLNSAPDALELLSHGGFDLLISDIGMPGMDGFEMIRQIRAGEGGSRPKLRAIALTAFSRTDDRDRALKLGFDAFLSKPADPADLVAHITRLLPPVPAALAH